METKTVYQTNQLGLYIGTTEADESPLEPGVFLIPGGCVEVEPPKIPANKGACWSNGKWVLVDYFDGLIVYSTTTGEPLTVTGVGPIPSGYTTKKPGPDQVWKNGDWVDDIAAITHSTLKAYDPMAALQYAAQHELITMKRRPGRPSTAYVQPSPDPSSRQLPSQ